MLLFFQIMNKPDVTTASNLSVDRCTLSGDVKIEDALLNSEILAKSDCVALHIWDFSLGTGVSSQVFRTEYSFINGNMDLVQKSNEILIPMLTKWRISDKPN